MKKIEDIVNNKNDIFFELSSLVSDTKEEQDNKEKLIEEKYRESLKKLERENDKINKNLSNYVSKIADYSRFDKKKTGIIDVLIDLTSLFMGEKYICGNLTNGILNQCILYPESLDLNYVKKNYTRLNSEKKIIDLADEDMGEYLQFYTSEDLGDITDDNPEFFLYISDSAERNNFIDEFIQFVVKFRILNKEKNLTNVKLKILLKEFVILNKDKIIEINKNIAEKEQQKIKENFEKREALLQNYVQENGEPAIGGWQTSGNSAVVLRKLIETYNKTSEC